MKSQWKYLAVALLLSAVLQGCAGGKQKPAPRPASTLGRVEAEQLFRMLVTLEALEQVTGTSEVWKRAVTELPDSRTVSLLERSLGGGRFTAFDVEAGARVYRARFAEIETGDPVVEILWSVDGKNYPVGIGAPEGYREATVTDCFDRETRQLTGWNDGTIEFVITSMPVMIRWSKGVKAD